MYQIAVADAGDTAKGDKLLTDELENPVLAHVEHGLEFPYVVHPGRGVVFGYLPRKFNGRPRLRAFSRWATWRAFRANFIAAFSV